MCGGDNATCESVNGNVSKHVNMGKGNQLCIILVKNTQLARARVTSTVRLYRIGFNVNSSHLTSVPLAAFVSKLFFIEPLLANRADWVEYGYSTNFRSIEECETDDVSAKN